MWRVICAGALGVVMLSSRPLLAQGPPSKDSVLKLQAELDVLKRLIKDVEIRLEKARSAAMPKPGFGKGKGKGPGEFGKGKGKGPGGEFGKGKGPGPGYGKGPWAKPGEWGRYGPPGKGYAKGQWGRPGEYRKAPMGEWRAPSGRRPERGPAASNEEILRRLNQLIRDVEDLQRQVRRR